MSRWLRAVGAAVIGSLSSNCSTKNCDDRTCVDSNFTLTITSASGAHFDGSGGTHYVFSLATSDGGVTEADCDAQSLRGVCSAAPIKGNGTYSNVEITGNAVDAGSDFTGFSVTVFGQPRVPALTVQVSQRPPSGVVQLLGSQSFTPKYQPVIEVCSKTCYGDTETMSLP